MTTAPTIRVALAASISVAAFVAGPSAHADTPGVTATVAFECDADGHPHAEWTATAVDQIPHSIDLELTNGGPYGRDFETVLPQIPSSAGQNLVDGEVYQLRITEQGTVLVETEMMQADETQPTCFKVYEPQLPVTDPTVDIELDCTGEVPVVFVTAHRTDDSQHRLDLTVEDEAGGLEAYDVSVGPHQLFRHASFQLPAGARRYNVVQSVPDERGIFQSEWLTPAADGSCQLVGPVEDQPAEDPPAVADDPTPTTAPTVTPAPTTPAQVEAVAVTPAAAPELPRTGTPSAALAAGGLTLLALGTALVRSARIAARGVRLR